jgi:hypothetical protein
MTTSVTVNDRDQTNDSAVVPVRRPIMVLLAVGLALGLWVAVDSSLSAIANVITHDLLHLEMSGRLGSAVEFFVFEAPKVLLLLTLVVFVVGVLRSFFTAERTRAILAGKRESVGGMLAALLGTLTPFCSCSAVPLLVGCVAAGVPLGVTFSFLIAAPMVNEVALALLFGMFGWRVASLYLATGLAVASGSNATSSRGSSRRKWDRRSSPARPSLGKTESGTALVP